MQVTCPSLIFGYKNFLDLNFLLNLVYKGALEIFHVYFQEYKLKSSVFLFVSDIKKLSLNLGVLNSFLFTSYIP